MGSDSRIDFLVPINFHGLQMQLLLEPHRGSGGSHKEYAAASVVHDWLVPVEGLGSTRCHLILSSSGNTARAIAAETALLGIILHVVTDVLSVPAQIEALRPFKHVKIIVVDRPDARSGSHMAARMEEVARLQKQFDGDGIYLDQYRASAFPEAYARTLAAAIDEAVPHLATVFVPVGTGGAALGLEIFRKRFGRTWTVRPVDVPGSRLFDPEGKDSSRRIFPGIGNGFQTEFAKRLPSNMQPIVVPSEDVVRACRFLAERRDLKLGPSSGAAVAAVALAARQNALPHFGAVVVICPDGGNAYQSTIYNDDWILDKGLGKAIQGP